MERYKIQATKTATKGFTLTHWSKLSKTGENLEAACGSQGEGWNTVPDWETYEVEGVEYKHENTANCHKCRRKYGL